MPLVLDGTTGFSGGGGVATSTALGSSALFTNSSGANLVAIGYQAGYFTTAGPNVFVGSQAGYTNSTGTNNIGIGRQALYSNTTAANNTAVGYQSFYSSTGAAQVGLGYQAGYNSSGSSNLAIGYQALYSNTGTNIYGIGYQALYNNTGADNYAYGYQSLNANTSGGNNVAMGLYTLKVNTTGGTNTAIGNYALYSNTTASTNTAVGYQAGYNHTTGGDSVFLGWQAGKGVSTGANNICIGSNSGNYTTAITTGGQCIYLGTYTTASSSSVTYEIVVGYAASGKGANTGFINSLSTYNGGNSSSWNTTSDRRLKKNIVDNTEGLDIISQIRVRNFEYRIAAEVTELPAHSIINKQGVQLGVIAQELQEVCSDCVKEETTGVLSVDSDNIFWHMVNAIKELKTLVDAQSALITTQAAEIVALKAKVGL